MAEEYMDESELGTQRDLIQSWDDGMVPDSPHHAKPFHRYVNHGIVVTNPEMRINDIFDRPHMVEPTPLKKKMRGYQHLYDITMLAMEKAIARNFKTIWNNGILGK